MQIVVKGSFYRDWKHIRNKDLSKVLRKKIDVLESVRSISQITHIKKLRNYSSRYKIEIVSGKKTYWILCVVFGNNIEFLRLKSETYFKKNL